MYRSLEIEKIHTTVVALARRVEERFPGSGLAAVAQELGQAVEDTSRRCRWITEPKRWLRAFVAVIILLLVGSLVATLFAFEVATGPPTFTELIQATEAGINDLVLVGLAIAFLLSVEGRLKRRHALQGLSQLRALAHVIDMHQLTKDPERLDRRGASTASSPKQNMTAFELVRYLDYSSEMLSLTAKAAALYGQHLDDPVVLNGMTDIEDLTANLSNKIWQKIGMVESFRQTHPGA